jgi:hypothetical protein
MTIKELLRAQIDALDEQDADAVLHFVRQLAAMQPRPSGGDLLTRLQEIHIQGPTDFAANLDLYLSGEKRVTDHVH